MFFVLQYSTITNLLFFINLDFGHFWDSRVNLIAMRTAKCFSAHARNEELFSFPSHNWKITGRKASDSLCCWLNHIAIKDWSFFFRNVIQALAEGTRRHIPYRNSTLTRLLQEGLHGNSKTSLIVRKFLDLCDSRWCKPKLKVEFLAWYQKTPLSTYNGTLIQLD